jgi:hypothetical protein
MQTEIEPEQVTPQEVNKLRVWQRLDHPVVAAINALVLTMFIVATIMPLNGLFTSWLMELSSRTLKLFLLPTTLTVCIFLGAWLGGVVTGTWMPKSAKKGILWSFGIYCIPYHVIYIFPQLVNMWQEYKMGSENLESLLSVLALTIFIYPAAFLGVFLGAKWASQKRLNKRDL